MAEFDVSTFSEAKDYSPTAAVLCIVANDGTTDFEDTISLDPEWCAALIKAIRQGNQGLFMLDGCLPANSPELKPNSKHIFERKRPRSRESYKNWLQFKPAV